jgi:hypothetical protein
MATEVDAAETPEKAQLGINAEEEFHQQCLLFPAYATKHAPDGWSFFIPLSRV